MANIVIGVFDEYANAEAARDELIAAGVDEHHIRITQRDRPPREQEDHDRSGFWENIRDYFGIDDDDEGDEDTEGRLLGSAVITVIARSDTLDTIVSIIRRHEPENIDQHSAPGERLKTNPQETSEGEQTA